MEAFSSSQCVPMSSIYVCTSALVGPIYNLVLRCLSFIQVCFFFSLMVSRCIRAYGASLSSPLPGFDNTLIPHTHTHTCVYAYSYIASLSLPDGSWAASLILLQQDQIIRQRNWSLKTLISKMSLFVSSSSLLKWFVFSTLSLPHIHCECHHAAKETKLISYTFTTGTWRIVAVVFLYRC